MSDTLGLGRSNFGPLWQIRVQTKPSKQPLGLVNMGVPIEKGRAKQAMHLDWGGPTLDKVMDIGFEVSPRNNPSDWLHMELQSHAAPDAPKGRLGRFNFRQG